VGPFHQWPTGSGFEYFYGFVGGEANQYYPGLYEGTTPIEPPKLPEDGYTLTEDLADRAITWVRQQKALTPDKPFFTYFAPGATHSKIDDFGTPNAYNHYAVGWAHALCTPYQWTKQIASHWGGTRNGTIVHWPNGFTDKGATRNQFHHVIDVAPTLLEAAGLPAPFAVNGIQQAPLEGVSMLAMLRDGNAPETHDVQYFEIMGNRGIYHQGWTAVTKHRTPWLGDAPPFDQDIWELYGPDDWTQAHDLAKENPEKLAELQRLWLIEAVKYNVVPLDVRALRCRHRRSSAVDPREQSVGVHRHAPQRELCFEREEQIALGDGESRDPGIGCERCHRHPGRQRRWLDPVCPRRKAQILLQLLRHRLLHRDCREAHSSR
jgi:arylsulfatase A-like enzyme